MSGVRVAASVIQRQNGSIVASVMMFAKSIGSGAWYKAAYGSSGMKALRIVFSIARIS